MASVGTMKAPGAYAQRAPNARIEAPIQERIAAMLRAYLPDEIWWSASLSGVKLTPRGAADAKKAGMQKGAPDLSFIFPDGSTRYLEVKGPDGVLTPEQRQLATVLGDRMAVVRSWPEARAALDVWMAGHGLRFLTDTESYQRDARRRGVKL